MEILIQTLHDEMHDKLREAADSIFRDIVFPEIQNKIKVAIGMRRSGKTYFLLQQIQKLLHEGIPDTRILYINFEDDRLLPLTRQKLADLVDGFYSLYPDNHDQRCYLFLDEIQNVEDWAIVIRRLSSTKNAEIFLSGSSAKLLSKEIATSLRGRSISKEIWPLSFAEYMQFKGIEQPKIPYGQKTKDRMQDLLKTYLAEGGFPEVTHLQAADRTRVLQDYVSVVLLRDIVERHGITNIHLLRYMIKTILRNAGTSLSINKFFNDLKSQGIPVAKSTLYEYLDHIEDAYLAFSISVYSESLRKSQVNPRKIYAIDPGMVHAYKLHFTQNIGHVFENLVYLDLRRQEHEVYYYLSEERYEVDFMTKSYDGTTGLYQVAWDIDDQATLDREVRALKKAEEELGVTGYLITKENYIPWACSGYDSKFLE